MESKLKSPADPKFARVITNRTNPGKLGSENLFIVNLLGDTSWAAKRASLLIGGTMCVTCTIKDKDFLLVSI